MDIKEYSNEAIVNVFTSFMKESVMHYVIDYARIIRRPRVIEVSFDEVLNVQMSLSTNIDDDIFYLLEIKEIRAKFERGFNKLTKREKTLVRLLELDYSASDISRIMKIDLESVYSLKSRTKKKFKKYMED